MSVVILVPPMRTLRLCCLALALFAVAASSSTAHAQQATDHRYGTWTGLFAHGPIKGDVWLWVDLQPRFYDSFEPQSVLVRPGISWRAMPALFATLGYAWVPQWTQTPDPHEWGDINYIDEHRIWEQLNYTPSDLARGLSGQFRLRGEQRFRTAGPSDVGVRLRMMARGQVAIDRARNWFLISWDELFIALNDAGTWQSSGFDQNRFFAGVGLQVVPAQLRLEFGYVNQWLFRAGTDPVNHIASLTAYLNWQ